jgi:hypothetical protein
MRARHRAEQAQREHRAAPADEAPTPANAPHPTPRNPPAQNEPTAPTDHGQRTTDILVAPTPNPRYDPPTHPIK